MGMNPRAPDSTTVQYSTVQYGSVSRYESQGPGHVVGLPLLGLVLLRLGAGNRHSTVQYSTVQYSTAQ